MTVLLTMNTNKQSKHLLSGEMTMSVTLSLNFAGFTTMLFRLLIIIAECESGSKALKRRGSELWNSRVIFIMEPVLIWKPWLSPL